MIIQIVLIVGFVLLLGRFLANPNSYQIKAWKKITGILLVLLAIVAVLFPDTLNHIANWVGVGRGADLLLYLLAIAFIFVVFGQYISSKQEQQRVVQLARKIALLEAEMDNASTRRKTAGE
jgi:hypothetical protein